MAGSLPFSHHPREERPIDLFETLRDALADRYTLEREIGTGGMATVFLAEESHPRRKVAIKVMSPEFAPTVLRDRFLREIELVSKLTHPHIVPVFAAGEACGFLYYVMPYVEGDTLRQRLTRGPVSIGDAVRIAGEVASALEYAHQHGIVHRDIKPENILFSGGHAMVADFGVARAMGPTSRTLTQPGYPVGTPRYMSPEQWAGSGEVDGRADIYSTACVLLEMVAGTLPEGSPVERLDSMPGTVRRSVSSSPSRASLMGVLKRALAVDPADRHQTAADFRLALQGGLPAVPGRRRPTAAGIVTAALAVVVIAALVVGSLRPRERAAVGPARVVVAVFDNRTGDPELESVGVMAADWITQGLAETGLVEVVGLRTTLASESQVRAAADPVQSLARETGAEIVVWGDYYRSGGDVQFQAKITDARTAALVRSLDPVAAPAGDPLSAVQVLRQRVTGALAAVVDEDLSQWADLTSAPPSVEAYRQYVEGMRYFMSLNVPAALQRFDEAAAEDSSFVLPVLFASFATATTGDWRAADSLARHVEPRRDRLTPFDRDLLDWVIAGTRGDNRTLLEAARRMSAASPESEAAVLHAMSATAVNRPREAVDALLRADPDRGLLRVFFLYWHMLAGAYHMLGQDEEALAAAQEGQRRFPSSSGALAYEAQASIGLGRLSDADSLLQLMEERPPEIQWLPGDASRQAALEAAAHGYQEAASVFLDRALNWYAELSPADASEYINRYGLARVLYQRGDYGASEEIFRSLRRDRPDSVAHHGYLGAIAARRGDREAALAISESLAALDGPYRFGSVAYWQARIAAVLGERERALSLYRRAIDEGFQFNPGAHFDVDLSALRGMPEYDELLRPKG